MQDILDPVTSQLFEDSFPREITSKRKLITTPRHFEQEIDILNGAIEDLYTNVNPINGEINKISIDFDGAESLKESQKLCTYLLGLGIPCIPVASGRRGVHLHVLFKTRKGEDNKEILYKTTKSLLLKSLPKNKAVDPHLIGNTRAMIRIPNTLRPPENMSFCTYLPPGKAFLEMTETDLATHIRGTHYYLAEDYGINKHPPTFEEFILPEVDKEQVQFAEFDNSKSVHYSDNEQLKHLLRPCLYRLMTVEEPRHKVRVAATADLLRSEISPNQILDMYRSLNWRDWDEKWTAYQIGKVKTIYWHKKKLKQLGICYDCGRSCF